MNRRVKSLIKSFKILEANDQSIALFKDVVQAISGFEYAIIGSIALRLVADVIRKPTKDVDFLMYYENRGGILSNLSKIPDAVIKNLDDSQISVSKPECDVYFDILFSSRKIEPEYSTIYTAIENSLYGVPIKVAKPIMLLWMYIISPLERHLEDAKLLISSKAVSSEDIEDLKFLIVADEEQDLSLNSYTINYDDYASIPDLVKLNNLINSKF